MRVVNIMRVVNPPVEATMTVSCVFTIVIILSPSGPARLPDPEVLHSTVIGPRRESGSNVTNDW